MDEQQIWHTNEQQLFESLDREMMKSENDLRQLLTFSFRAHLLRSINILVNDPTEGTAACVIEDMNADLSDAFHEVERVVNHVMDRDTHIRVLQGDDVEIPLHCFLPREVSDEISDILVDGLVYILRNPGLMAEFATVHISDIIQDCAPSIVTDDGVYMLYL